MAIKHKRLRDENSHTLGWLQATAPVGVTVQGTAWVATGDGRLWVFNGSTWDAYALLSEVVAASSVFEVDNNGDLMPIVEEV